MPGTAAAWVLPTASLHEEAWGLEADLLAFASSLDLSSPPATSGSIFFSQHSTCTY